MAGELPSQFRTRGGSGSPNPWPLADAFSRVKDFLRAWFAFRPRSATAAEIAPARPKRVLVVDDEIASDIAIWLNLPEWEAAIVDGVDPAIRALESDRFDVVILDMYMPFKLSPEEAGMVVLNWIDRYQPGLPVVILTAMESSDVARPALELGASGYLSKEDFELHLTTMLHEVVSRAPVEAQQVPGPDAAERHEASVRERLLADVKESRRVQRAMLPAMLSVEPGLTIAGSNIRLIGASGDAFDFLYDRARNRVAFLICDVTGHGVATALVASRLCGAFRAAIRHGSSLGEVDLQLHETLRDLHMAVGEDIDLYAEGTVGVLHIPEKRLELLSSGGLQPTLRAGGECVFAGRELGHFPWWGMDMELPRGPVDPEVIDFRPGRSLVFFTDGIANAKGRAKTVYGAERVRAGHARFGGSDARSLSEHILHNAIDYGARDPDDSRTGLVLSLDDDATVLALHWAE